MSSGAECGFTEAPDGTWTYWLQNWPYGETDEGETYGPFPSFEVAERHLSDNHQNPGGYSVTRQLDPNVAPPVHVPDDPEGVVLR